MLNVSLNNTYSNCKKKFSKIVFCEGWNRLFYGFWKTSKFGWKSKRNI